MSLNWGSVLLVPTGPTIWGLDSAPDFWNLPTGKLSQHRRLQKSPQGGANATQTIRPDLIPGPSWNLCYSRVAAAGLGFIGSLGVYQFHFEIHSVHKYTDMNIIHGVQFHFEIHSVHQYTDMNINTRLDINQNAQINMNTQKSMSIETHT